MSRLGTVAAGLLAIVMLVVAVFTYRPVPYDRVASEQCREVASAGG